MFHLYLYREFLASVPSDQVTVSQRIADRRTIVTYDGTDYGLNGVDRATNGDRSLYLFQTD